MSKLTDEAASEHDMEDHELFKMAVKEAGIKLKLANVTEAITNLKSAMDHDRKVSHSKHYDENDVRTLNDLETLRDALSLKLSRIKLLGC